MRKVESRGEGAREVKARGGPGLRGAGHRGRERRPGLRNGGLLAPGDARGRDRCGPGGAHLQGSSPPSQGERWPELQEEADDL